MGNIQITDTVMTDMEKIQSTGTVIANIALNIEFLILSTIKSHISAAGAGYAHFWRAILTTIVDSFNANTISVPELADIVLAFDIAIQLRLAHASTLATVSTQVEYKECNALIKQLKICADKCQELLAPHLISLLSSIKMLDILDDIIAKLSNDDMPVSRLCVDRLSKLAGIQLTLYNRNMLRSRGISFTEDEDEDENEDEDEDLDIVVEKSPVQESKDFNTYEVSLESLLRILESRDEDKVTLTFYNGSFSIEYAIEMKMTITSESIRRMLKQSKFMKVHITSRNLFANDVLNSYTVTSGVSIEPSNVLLEDNGMTITLASNLACAEKCMSKFVSVFSTENVCMDNSGVSRFDETTLQYVSTKIVMDQVDERVMVSYALPKSCAFYTSISVYSILPYCKFLV